MANGKKVIDASSLIPIGHLLVLIGIFTGGAIWVTRVDGRLENIENALTGVVDVRKVETWIDVFRAQNPDLAIPELSR